METVKFNGVDLGRLFTIGEPSRPTPDFRLESTAISGMDGSSFDSLTYGKRTCSFTLSVERPNKRKLQDAGRSLMALLSVRSPKPLAFSDERDSGGTQLVRYAVPEGAFDFDEFVRAGRWHCSFSQVDPYLYGKQRSVVLKPSTGTTVKSGGADAYPMVEFRPASGRTNPIIFQDLTAGKLVKIYPATSFRHKVTLNTKNLYITSDDAVTLGTDSRIFPLTESGKLVCNVPATLTWRERFL